VAERASLERSRRNRDAHFRAVRFNPYTPRVGVTRPLPTTACRRAAPSHTAPRLAQLPPAHTIPRRFLGCLLFAVPLFGLGSCKAPGVPVPTVDRAIRDAVTVAYHSGVETLSMTINVAYSAKVGKGGTAFASTSDSASSGSTLTYALSSKAAIAEAYEAMQATDLTGSGLNALAELDRGTGAIKKSSLGPLQPHAHSHGHLLGVD